MKSIAAVLLLVSIPSFADAQDWPRFRGADGFGVGKEKGTAVSWSRTENLAWTVDLPGPGTSSPILVGDRIYLTCYSGYNVPGLAKGDMKDLKLHLLCLNRSDGKQVWSKDVEPKLPEQARIRDDHGYASSTPTADKYMVYCFFGKSGVHAFTHEGKHVWQADVGSKLSDWGSAASPILHDDLLIVNASVESESLYALDRKTGKEQWRVKGIRESWNTPILVPVKGGKTELVVAVFGKILGLDPTTGKQLWSCDTDIRWYMVPSMVAEDGIVYCLGGRSGTAALAVRAGGSGDVTATHRLWTSVKGSNVTSPVVQDGKLYWMHEGLGIAYCVEGKTGKIVYEERVGRFDNVYASTLLADGKLYYVGRDGRVLVLAAKPTYEKLGLNDLRDRSLFHAGAVPDGGRLLIRSNKALYCIEKQKP